MAEICGENFEIQCGEVFLHLLNGKLTFHCTLCESKYQHFQNYADHVASEHSPSMELDDELEENVVNDEISAYERNLDEKIKQEVPIKNENESLAFEESSFNSFPEEYDTEDQELFNEDQEFFNEYEVGKEELDDEAFVDMQFQDGPRKRGRKSKPEPVLIPTEDARPVKIKYINKNDDRKFRCPNCDFSCKLKRNLKGHLRRHAKEKPYPCKYCEKGFYTTTELKVHLRTHTGERPYSCEECGAGFITFAKLNEHRRVHSEKESHFECEDCGKIFSTPHRLRSHRAQHKKDELLETTKNPIYECALCNAQFLDRAYLNIHLQDEHMSVYI